MMRDPCNISVTSSKRKFLAERNSFDAAASLPKMPLFSTVFSAMTIKAPTAATCTSQKRAQSVITNCMTGPQTQ